MHIIIQGFPNEEAPDSYVHDVLANIMRYLRSEPSAIDWTGKVEE